MNSFQKVTGIFIIVISLFMGMGPLWGEEIGKTPIITAAVPNGNLSTIQQISFVEGERYIRIHVEGSETIAPPFYRLSQEPLRIVMDIPNIDLRQVKNSLKMDSSTISEILTTQYDDKGRIEIGLLQMTNYNISREDRNLFVDVERVKNNLTQEVKTDVIPEELKLEKPLITSLSKNPSDSGNFPKAKKIQDVSFEEKNDFIDFNIQADGKVENYNSFKLEGPPRLVLDIWNVTAQNQKKSIKVSNPFIREVRFGQYDNKVRLVFDASKPQLPPYQINRLDSKLVVSIGNVPQTSEPQILVQAASPLPSSPVVEKAPVVAQASSPTTVKATSTLKDIDFKQMDNKSRIVLVLTEEPQFEALKISEKMLAVDIKNTFAPKHQQRSLNTSAFDSVVHGIDIKNVKIGKGNDVRILIKLKEEIPYEITKEEKTLFIDIDQPKKVLAKVEPPPTTKVEEKKVEPPVEAKAEVMKVEDKPSAEPKEVKKEEKVTPKVEEKSAPHLPVAKQTEEVVIEKNYVGRKVSLDFKDADIKNILRLIAEVSNFNIITADDVSGKITMRLVDVPWDQALDVILQARSLGMVQVGNVIRIAPVETLNKESQAKLETKRARDRLEDMVTELIPINYAAGKDIIPQIKGILSDRGDVKVDERTNILIIKDIPRNIPNVRLLVKSLDTKTPQILIEARIVEANTAFQRDLGVSWGFLASGGDKKNLTVGGGTASATTLPGTATPTNKVVDLPAVVPSGGTGTVSILEFLFTSDYGLKQLDIAISAYENKGQVNIVSSPKIATLDNKEASIEQGLRIPYSKRTEDGSISEDFIDANLKLTVTPHVTNDGYVKMTIKVKKDAPDYAVTSTFGTPRIDKKEAITEVLVKDNAIAVIAGIYTIDKSQGTTGVPLFNKIPLLGWLFKKESDIDDRKDLLIFISPKILKDQV